MIIGEATFPRQMTGMNVTAFFDAILLDAAGEKAGFVFEVQKAGTVTILHFRLSGVTTGQTLRAGLYAVDASGNPTTTAYGGMAVGTVTVADTDDNTLKQVTLATPATMVAGDWVALVIEFDSTAGNLNISRSGGSSGDAFSTLYTGGAWGARSMYASGFALEYNDGTLGPSDSMLVSTFQNPGFHLDTAIADEYGTRFIYPFGGRIIGIRTALSLAASAIAEFNYYDGTTVVEQSVRNAIYTANNGQREWDVRFLNPIPYVAGTERRIAVRPTVTGATGQVGISYSALPSAAALATFGIDPTEWAAGRFVVEGTRRINQGAWSDQSLWLPCLFYPIFDQLDSGGRGGFGQLVSRTLSR